MLRQDPSGWWWVKIDGKEGDAPANYLEANQPVADGRTESLELKALRRTGLITDTQLASLESLHADLEVYTQSWVEVASRLLEVIAPSECAMS